MKLQDNNFNARLRYSYVLFVMSLVFFILLQLMTFFVALDGGYDSQSAFVFMTVPLLGPLFCSIQLLLAGTGSPAILILLFLSYTFTLLGWARFRDQYKTDCRIDGHSTAVRDIGGVSLNQLHSLKSQPVQKLKSQPAAQPKPIQPTASAQKPRSAPAPKPIPLTEPTPTPKTVPAQKPLPAPKSISQPVPKRDSASVKTAEAPKNANKPKTGIGEKYDKILDDVLSILNKY